MAVVASANAQSGSRWGATEDQVNMRLAVPQRIDGRGSKVDDLAGTCNPDALGG
jgi:hypothetical protein